MSDIDIFNQCQQQIEELLKAVLTHTENELLADFQRYHGPDNPMPLDEHSYWAGVNELRNDAIINFRRHFKLLSEKSPDSIN